MKKTTILFRRIFAYVFIIIPLLSFALTESNSKTEDTQKAQHNTTRSFGSCDIPDARVEHFAGMILVQLDFPGLSRCSYVRVRCSVSNGMVYTSFLSMSNSRMDLDAPSGSYAVDVEVECVYDSRIKRTTFNYIDPGYESSSSLCNGRGYASCSAYSIDIGRVNVYVSQETETISVNTYEIVSKSAAGDPPVILDRGSLSPGDNYISYHRSGARFDYVKLYNNQLCPNSSQKHYIEGSLYYTQSEVQLQEYNSH